MSERSVGYKPHLEFNAMRLTSLTQGKNGDLRTVFLPFEGPEDGSHRNSIYVEVNPNSQQYILDQGVPEYRIMQREDKTYVLCLDEMDAARLYTDFGNYPSNALDRMKLAEELNRQK